MKSHVGSLLALVLLIGSLNLTEAQDQRQNPQAAKPKPQQQKQTLQKQAPTGNITCGTQDELIRRIDTCAAPLMDILQGTIARWPRTDSDIGDLCQSFFGCERCIRDNSRKCAKGLQKTIISTLANSIQRVRKRECSSPSKFPPLLKTIQCMENNQKAVHEMMANATSYLMVVDNQMKDPDLKTTAVCCMVHDIELAIKKTLGPLCPAEANVVVRIYRAVLEDVVELICRQPKCKDVFRGYGVRRAESFDGIIAILLRIVFALG